MKKEILFGIHPIYEAIKNRRRVFSEIYIAKEKSSKRLEDIEALAKSLRISVKNISVAQLKSMTGTDQHQGVGAVVSIYPSADLSDMLDRSKFAENPPFLLLLDSVVDVHNLGALIRTALCAGVSGVIIPKDRAAPPSPAVSKASAGALEHVHLAQVTNLVNTIRELKENGIWIAGTDKEAGRSLFEYDLTVPLAIVIGGEEKGIRPLVKKHCDFLVSIPQAGPLNSLNASVAGAVLMYEIFRQRKGFLKPLCSFS